MRKITVTLNDSQYEFAKSKGRLWLRDVVQLIMDHPCHDPDYQPEPLPKRRWWEVWK